MKFYKLFILAIIFVMIAGLAGLTKAQENSDLANALAEFENDQATAKSLGLDEISVLPGESSYWWQLTKEKIGLFFSFSQESKIQKLEQIASRRLLEAKELSETGTDNAANQVMNALGSYQQTMSELTERLNQNPQIKEKLLAKFDSNQLRHQEVLSSVAEKLRAKKQEQENLQKLERLRQQVTAAWYNTEPEQIEPRLKQALTDNNVGSKFKPLINMATLEELKEILPDNTLDKIEAAKQSAAENLANNLKELAPNDQEKLEKYINNIKTPDLIKQQLMSELKEDQKMPAAVRQTATSAFSRYTSQLRTRFDSLTDEQKQEFLNQFADKLRSHPANVEFLQSLDEPALREKIRQMLELQLEGLKEKIQTTTDPAKLRSLEENLSQYPAMQLQIRERMHEIEDGSPVRMRQN